MKTSRTPSITSKTARDRLPSRREPYWARLRSGLYLGFRKLASGEGTWIVRQRREDTGQQAYVSLGECPDFDSAARLALDRADVPLDRLPSTPAPLAAPAGPVVAPAPGATVQDACTHYLAYIRLHKSTSAARNAEQRFKRLVYGDPLALRPLAELRVSDIRVWVNSQIRDEDSEAIRRSKDTANRNLASFKAALNLAHRDDLVGSDAGWRTVTQFKGVGRRREGFVPAEERAALMSKCSPSLRVFVKALLLTAARPGELANVRVSDLDVIQGTLKLDGKTGKRTVPLSSAARTFFSGLVAGREGAEWLLTYETKNYGHVVKFNKETWAGVFREAVREAGLRPDIVMYSLRHTAISEMIAGGMDTFVVAKLAGTSTEMIDKHHGHLRHDQTRDMLDSVVLV